MIPTTGWSKGYSWGRPDAGGSSSGSKKYIPPGKRTPVQAGDRGPFTVPIEVSKITNKKPTLTPMQAAIATITLAISGTGPTFSAEMIRDIDIGVQGIQRSFPSPSRAREYANSFVPTVLVLSKTRNLALQVHSILRGLAEPMNLRSVVCAGGGKEPHGWQHIVSGTPARVANLIERRTLEMTQIRILVLNMEQDIQPSFHQQIYDVYRHLPPGTKIVRGTAAMGFAGSKK